MIVEKVCGWMNVLAMIVMPFVPWMLILGILYYFWS
jgi:hypothetical protein